MTTIQDNIDFVLSAESTLVNDTVKLIANISATIIPPGTQETLITDIRAMMQRLITDAKWNFSGMIRGQESSGLEKITLQASARVSETENHSLDDRIREVSRKGMTIESIDADTTPPAEMIEKYESDLRVSLLKKAKDELGTINKAMGTNYRLGVITFQQVQNNHASNYATMSSKVAQAASYGSGFSADMPGGSAPETLGNAVKLMMKANVSLRMIVGT